METRQGLKALFAAAALAAGCGGGTAVEGFRAVIGPEGGRLDGPDGTAVVVPQDAVGKPVEFFIEPGDPSVLERSDELKAVGPAYRFGPEHQEFARMVTVVLPFKPGLVPTGYSLEDVEVFLTWDGVDWQPIATNAPAPGDTIVMAAAPHFSFAVAAVRNRPR